MSAQSKTSRMRIRKLQEWLFKNDTVIGFPSFAEGVTKPSVVWSRTQKFAVFMLPGWHVFNSDSFRFRTNPEVYTPLTHGLGEDLQVEPDYSVYIEYWDPKKSTDDFFSSASNSFLWSHYYKDWYAKHKDDPKAVFPRTLADLEAWCFAKIAELGI